MTFRSWPNAELPDDSGGDGYCEEHDADISECGCYPEEEPMRAKLYCGSVIEKFHMIREKDPSTGEWKETGEKQKYAEEVTLYPVYAPSDQPEHPNHAFFKSTPSGICRLEINNSLAWGHFVAGREYFF